MKKHIEFNLLGKTYKIKVGEDVEDVDKLTSYFVKKVEKLCSSKGVGKNSKITDVQILILVCLDIVNEFIKLEKKQIETKSISSDNSFKIINLLDKTINDVS